MFRISPRGHTTFAALLCLALIPFIRLGEGDLQNDEVIYAAHAQEIFSHSGLTLEPSHRPTPVPGPISVWGMALAFKAFGFSSFSARLISALSFGLLLLASYFFARRIIGPRAALGVAALLASSSLIFRFAQLAQGDMLSFALAIFGMTLFAFAWELKRGVLAVGCGVMFGLSYLSSGDIPIVPIVVLMIWGVGVSVRSAPDRWKVLQFIAFVFGSAMVVDMAWLLWESNGNSIWTVPTSRELNRLFTIGRVLSDVPVGALVLVLGTRRIWIWWKERTWAGEPWEIWVWFWLVVAIVGTIIVPHKNMGLNVLLPLAVLACLAVDVLMSAYVSAWWRIVALTGVVCEIVVEHYSFPALIVGVLVIAATAWFAPSHQRLLQRILWAVPAYGAALLVLVRVVEVATEHQTVRVTGARQIAESLPSNLPVLLLTDRDCFAAEQFECYDPSKSLHNRIVLASLRSFTDAPARIPDSLHTVVIEKPTAQSVPDIRIDQAGANLRQQQFVVLERTSRYDVYARGLLLEK